MINDSSFNTAEVGERLLRSEVVGEVANVTLSFVPHAGGSHVSYLVAGTTCLTFNVLLFVAVVSSKRFDKEIAFITAFCVTNIVQSTGYVSAAIRRLTIRESAMSQLQCLLESIHVGCYELSDNFSALLLVAITLDRFTALVFWRSYKFITARVVSTVLMAMAGVAMIAYVVLLAFLAVRGRDRLISSYCLHGEVSPRHLYVVHTWFLCVSSYTSAIVYSFLLVRLVCSPRSRTFRHTFTRIKMRRERAITRRMSVLVAVNVAFNCVPFTVLNFLQQVDSWHYVLADQYVWIVHLFSLSCGVLLYSRFNPTVWNSLNRLFLRRLARTRCCCVVDVNDNVPHRDSSSARQTSVALIR